MRSLIILFCLLPMVACGQIDSISEASLQYRIKQLDEFMKRFNYEIDMKGEKISNRLDLEARKHQIATLFDKEMIKKADKAQQQQIVGFIEQVCLESKSWLISFSDSNWYAEALCQVKYKGKVQKISVILKTEQDSSKNQRWSIASVKMPFLDWEAKDSSKFLTPVSHELNFMQLSEATTKEKDNITAFAAKGTNINPLGIFFYLVKSGELQINFVEKITYHFLQVPNYIFTVEHFERAKGNVGWLISYLQVATVAQKQSYKQF